VLTARRTAAPTPLIGAAADAQTVSRAAKVTIDHEKGSQRMSVEEIGIEIISEMDREFHESPDRVPGINSPTA